MPLSANLGMPFVEAGQAQKHVTLNEALRILDASIHLSVVAVSSSAPSSPEEGERHIVAAGSDGAFSGQTHAIATFEDGAWRFLAPRTGWRAWVEVEDILYVFDGDTWRDLRDLSVELDDVLRLGINTASEGENRLAVRSNAALFHAVADADGGSGDVRIQISKEAAPNTASVFFSNGFEGRAEFGLAGSDDFSLKVSADGENWIESLVISAESGSVALPFAADLQSAIKLSGGITPPEITSNRNDYDPDGFADASVLRLSSDASRAITGLQAAADGRLVAIQNAGSNAIILRNEDAASSSANRFATASDITLAAAQCAVLQYDAAASRWRALAAPASSSGGSPDLSALHLVIAKLQMRVADLAGAPVNWIGAVSDSFDNASGLNIGGSTAMDTSEAGVIKPTSSTGTNQLPTMTAATTSGVTITASSEYAGGYQGWRIGDRVTSISGTWVTNGTPSGTVEIDFGTAKVLTGYSVMPLDGYLTRAPKDWTFQGWNGSSWVTLDTRSAQTFASHAKKTYSFTNTAGYTKYRFNVTANNGDGYMAIEEVELFDPAMQNDMTAISAAFDLPAEPDAIDLLFVIEKIDPMTPDTDFAAAVSIDGGTNFDAGSIEELGTVGALTICRAAAINVAARDGTSLRWRITTHNNKCCKIHDIAARAY